MIKIDYANAIAETYVSYETRRNRIGSTLVYRGENESYTITHISNDGGVVNNLQEIPDGWIQKLIIKDSKGNIVKDAISDRVFDVFRIHFGQSPNDKPVTITPIHLGTCSQAIELALGLDPRDRFPTPEALVKHAHALERSCTKFDINLSKLPPGYRLNNGDRFAKVSLIQTNRLIFIPRLVRISDEKAVCMRALYAYLQTASTDEYSDGGIISDLRSAEAHGKTRICCSVKALATMISSGGLRYDLFDG